MSYLSRLEEARRQLVSGDFLAAERHYWAAREEWEQSKLRAPVLEKGVEPLLRLGGRLFGRDPDKPVLASFREREAAILGDLRDVAVLLQRQTHEKSQLPGEQLAADDVEVLARALGLLRDSRIYELEPAQIWPLVRNYLDGSQRHGRSVDVVLLPAELAIDDEASRWLVGWAHGRRRRRAEDGRALSAWLVALLEPRCQPGQGLADDGDALALLCLLQLDDPAGAPRALQHGLRALAASPPPADAMRLLRIVTGLATNEERLAVGAVDAATLHEIGEAAARLGAAWPPPEIAELLQRRRLRERSQQLAIAWSAAERRLLLLRLDAAEVVDVLLFQIRDAPDGDPFASSLREARQRVERQVEPEASVLAAGEAPDWVRGALGERRILPLDALEAALGAPTAAQAPAAAQAVHPVFDPEDPLAVPWQALLQEARWLQPRLIAQAQRSCFGASWGRANLFALGRVGVQAAELFARAIAASGGVAAGAANSLQSVPGPLSLHWPWLWDRPRARGEVAPAPEIAPGDLLLLHHPSEAELAAYAIAHTPTQLYVDGEARAHAVAAAASAVLDPARVTVLPQHGVCPENALRLLERWVEESLARPARGFDALWLYAALASAPEGDLGAAAQPAAGEAAREELAQALGAAPEHCRLQAHGQCFDDQLDERQRRSLLTVQQLEQLGSDEQPIEQLLIDDLLPRCAQLDDAAALALLQRAAQAWQRARRAALWLAAPRLGPAALAGLQDLFGDRLPQLRAPAVAHALGLYRVPDGYRPACGLLSDEADALLRARLRRWADRRGAKAVWRLPEDEVPVASVESLPELHGASLQPLHPTVLVPRLCGREFRSDLALLRLAAASSFASAEVAVLDPRVHELRALLEHASGLRDWSPERALLADGRVLLGELPAREAPHWQRPLHAERLREVARALEQPMAAERGGELEQLCAGIDHATRCLAGAVRDDERNLIAACIARLARESLDGGPLGVRTLIWVADQEGEGRSIARALGLRHAEVAEGQEAPLEELLLELEAGRVQWLQLHPSALRHEDLRRFARRAQAVSWLLPRAERWWAGHPAARAEFVEALPALRDALAQSQAGCLAFVDDIEQAPGGEDFAAALGLRRRAVARTQAAGDWQLLRRRLPDPRIACGGCGEPGALAHGRQPCPVCGRARLDRPEPRVLAEAALLDGIAELLQRAGPQEALLLVAPDQRVAAQLKARLGIQARAGEALLASSRHSFAQSVCTLAELYDETPSPRRLLLPALPRDAASLRALLARLAAGGWRPDLLELLDHPVAWDTQRADDPEWGDWGPGAALHQLRWRASRSEIEFRFRQARRAPSAAEGALAQRGLGPESAADLPVEDRLEELLEVLVARGLSFAEGAAPLDTLRLDEFDPGMRESLRWLVDEALLDAETQRSGGADSDAALHEALLALPYDTAQALPELPSAVPSAEFAPPSAVAPGWQLGVAGSGRTQRLCDFAAGLRSRRRRLMLVPAAPALLPTAQRVASLRPRVELATVAELELAFLRHHHQADGYARAPRLLPSASSEEGRRLRGELLRELSRRYAAVAGAVPPVEIEDLQLLLEGRAPRIAAALAEGQSAPALDLALLAQCAAEARREAGWITPTELRRWSRETLEQQPFIAEAWRHRYAALLVDDAHAFAPDELAFVEQLFPEGARAFAADPNLLEAAPGAARGEAESESRRLPKELARAAGQLLAREGGRRVAPRSRRKGRGLLSTQRVLNLGACALRIEADARAGELASTRNAIFVSHRGDLEPLAARLREGGLAIWPAEEIARVCVEGPRQLLAALQLTHGLSTDLPAEEMAELAIVLLRAEGLYTPALDRHALARRLVSWRHGVSTEATRPAEALLLVLLDLQRQLASVWSLREAAQRIADAGLLARLLRGDAVTERLRRFLEQDGERPWRLLPSQIPARALADPLAPGPHLWMLRPEEANALEFDRVYSICSGLEAPEHHYRALSRAREQLVVLYAERDPFGDRP